MLGGITNAWLRKYFLDTFPEAILIGNVLEDRSSTNKAAVCQALGVEYLIDDQLHYMEQCAEIGQKSILFGDYPWNQAEQLPPGVQRYSDWSSLTKFLLDEQN
jgi:hypothetical protein